MEKVQAVKFIQEVFTGRFERERFRQFVHELLNRYDSSKSQPMQVPDAFIQHVKSCQRLGTYKSPGGELLDILVVNVVEDYKIERTRTALRDFVAHKLKRGDNYKEAALVAFVPPSLRNWRFSYVRMEYETTRDPKTGKIKPEERLTPARRYSYLVGVDEKSHTAQKQLLPLLADHKQDPELSAIEQSFSVEKVTKEFFTEYSRLFETTNKALTDLVKKDKVLRADFEAKHVDTVAFSKKLLGQIVFLYFIQKKGWLGVPKNGNWGDGPRDFLRQLIEKSLQQGKNIFNDVLEPLFYDTLATDRGHEAWCKTFQCRIPFLNGGLFEPIAGYDWESTEINFPNSLFTNQERSPQGDVGTGILDVFDRYNFTVNEAEPLEKEVAIDPEMLGKVFENLIEENRRKGLGAFYTPREIVHYMCQESLINYLDTGLRKLPSPLACPEQSRRVGEGQGEGDIARKDLEDWIHQSDQYAHYASAIEAGMLKGDHYPKPPESIRQYAREIDGLLRDILVCDPAIGSGAFPVGMMMEVVRARTALTPYFNDVAERTPYHFKRHAIQTSLYGVDIDIGAVEIAKLRLWLSLVVDEEDVQQIKPLPNLDYKIVTGNSLLGVEKNLFNNEQFRQLEELKPRFFNETDRRKKAQYKDQIEKLIYELTNGHEVFDFEIYFSEVFHAKGGFDVVIANPPYSSKLSIETKRYRAFFECVEYKCDPYAFFIELALRSARQEGVVAVIVPVTWMTNVYYEKLRRCLIDSKSLFQTNLIHGLAFETANVDTSLLFLIRGGVSREIFGWTVTDPMISSLDKSSRSYASVRREPRYDIVPNADQEWENVRSKIESNTLKLGSFAKISLGMKLAGNDNFVVSSRDKKHSDPIVFGSDISLYGKIKPSRFFDFATAKIIGGTKKPVIHRANNKILVQAIRNLSLQRRIVATLDTQGMCFIGTVNAVIPHKTDWDIYYLLGLINSTLLNSYFRHRFTTISLTSAFLGELPIKSQSSNLSLFSKISKLVHCRLSTQPTDPRNLEHEIDHLIYKLYNLTKEEIEIVENNSKRGLL